MAKRPKGALCVESAGTRHYICVPADKAKDLHDFLRNHKVRAAPPEPSFTGYDSIELAADSDVVGVQSLLDGWK